MELLNTKFKVVVTLKTREEEGLPRGPGFLKLMGTEGRCLSVVFIIAILFIFLKNLCK